ncbi:MAG: DUF4838 domain-containing protein [Victivallales bacterium]|nr:DUF4838 domain-containing protein [Victivallales bacterium]
MKKTLLLLTVCFSLLCGGNNFQIYKDGKPQAVIVMLQPEHRFAPIWAGDLARFAGLCTGNPLEIHKENIPGKNAIELNFREQRFEDDSFTIEFPDDQTMRISGTRNSVKSGIVYLLETYFNVRFLMQFPLGEKQRIPGYEADLETDCPHIENVSIPMVKVTKSPSVNFYRRMYQNYNWYTRNLGFYGGHGSTLFAFPISKYGPNNSWPQEILPIHGGKKLVLPTWDKTLKNPLLPYRHGWQPCWSTPASVTIAVDNIRESLNKNPVHPIHGKRYQVELSVNDNGGCCQCTDCLKAVNGKRNTLGHPDYSELYWTWINNVAMELKKTHPEIYIVAYAYREVFNPPSFKLPSNVLPQICREILIGSRVPSEREKIEKTLKMWSEKADKLFLYDYLDNIGLTRYVYMLPRVHIKSYADMFKMAWNYNVRGVYLEADNDIPMSGPTLYLISRLYWNIDADLDAHFREWCERAVGKKAAPFLMEYYQEWERYWLRPEIGQTAWGLSCTGTYMPLNESGTYTYPITEKDIAMFDSLMEKVVAYAETPLQKRRAQLFSRLWGLSRKSLECIYAAYRQPDGTIASAEDAIKLLNSIPVAIKAQEELKNDPFVSQKWNDIISAGICNFSGLSAHLHDEQVITTLKEILKGSNLPFRLKAILEILSGVKYTNQLANGSFENPMDFSWRVKETGELDSTHVSDGEKAYKVVNGAVSFTCQAEYGKFYMIMVDVFSEITGGEGRAEFLTNPRSGNGRFNTQYHAFKNIRLTKGWQTISNIVHVSGERNGMKADSIYMYFGADFFESDEPLWIDNVRIYKLD